MARHCSSRDFFRSTPNALLARYFAGRAWVVRSARPLGQSPP